jgi:two-component system CheB/CheR fusion protein
MNEELQSANEELETSKEELQSINEELQTVNAELNARVEELSRANSDIANLLESTQIATLFLDRTLSVKSFTPAAKDVFRLVESDLGRPITHVRSRLGLESLHEDAERVLRTLATIERRIQATDNGARYVMRMMPYRTVDNVIAGVVITFVDVTESTNAEARIEQLSIDLRDRLLSLETLLDLLPVGVVVQDSQRPGELRINRSGAMLLGEGTAGEPGAALHPVRRGIRLFQGQRELPPDEHPLGIAIKSGQSMHNFEGQLLRPDGSRLDVMVLSSPLRHDSGEVRGSLSAIVDISEAKSAETRQQELLYELQHRVKNIIATVSALAGRVLRPDMSAGRFVEAFPGPLRAMATTHELLARANWRGTSLGELVQTALRAHVPADGSGSGMRGPEVLIPPKAAATLGMVLNELATNAAKYGALASKAGRLDIEWQIVGVGSAATARLTWRESGGKEVAADMARGFGINFVERSIEYELQGTADMEPASGGLRWTLEFPIPESVSPS